MTSRAWGSPPGAAVPRLRRPDTSGAGVFSRRVFLGSTPQEMPNQKVWGRLSPSPHSHSGPRDSEKGGPWTWQTKKLLGEKQNGDELGKFVTMGRGFAFSCFTNFFKNLTALSPNSPLRPVSCPFYK